jgi:hypothetical protein
MRFSRGFILRGTFLLSAAWVAQASARQVDNGSKPESDWEQGYGYQFWRCRHGFYRGDGAFGQFCIVMPEQDTVVAITSGTKDMGEVMQKVWEHLLPALAPAPLAADGSGHETLSRKLASLVLPPQEGRATSALAAKVSGRRYAFPANDERFESIGLEVARGQVTLVSRADGRETRIPLAHGRWGTSAALRFGGRDERVAASGAWTAEDTYTARLCLHETPYVLTARLRFAGDEVTLERETNVSYGETKRPTLVGRAEPLPGRRR